MGSYQMFTCSFDYFNKNGRTNVRLETDTQLELLVGIHERILKHPEAECMIIMRGPNMKTGKSDDLGSIRYKAGKK